MNAKEIVHVISEEFGIKDYEHFEGNHYMDDDIIKIVLVEPHSGTDDKYMLRADFPETFERWSVCLFEEFFEKDEHKNDDEFKKVIGELKEFLNEKKKYLEEELSEE